MERDRVVAPDLLTGRAGALAKKPVGIERSVTETVDVHAMLAQRIDTPTNGVGDVDEMRRWRRGGDPNRLNSIPRVTEIWEQPPVRCVPSGIERRDPNCSVIGVVDRSAHAPCQLEVHRDDNVRPQPTKRSSDCSPQFQALHNLTVGKPEELDVVHADDRRSTTFLFLAQRATGCGMDSVDTRFSARDEDVRDVLAGIGPPCDCARQPVLQVVRMCNHRHGGLPILGKRLKAHAEPYNAMVYDTRAADAPKGFVCLCAACAGHPACDAEDAIVSSRPYLPIGDYALIGDCHSTALVSSEGSIDWACLRRFDRPSTFGRLLDHDRGGHFSMRPDDEIVSASRRYLPGTMVLETTLGTDGGTIVLTDAFVMSEAGALNPKHQLIRCVDCTDGDLAVNVCIQPRFDYGGATPWFRRAESGSWSATASDDSIVIQADCHLEFDPTEHCLRGRLDMSVGDHRSIVVTSQHAHQLDFDVPLVDARKAIVETTNWWLEWSGRTTADGPHSALISRSALVLKALCCAPTGAIVAAATTSLPEVVGGSANWDYRACWIRDSTLTLAALAMVGHEEVAQGFRTFIMRTAAGDPAQLQIMYGPYGERRLPELELDLHGWRGSRPVRIGNAAASQVQLDMYGHLIDGAHLWHAEHHDIDQDEWRFLTAVVEQAVERWQAPDSGIWELRGEPLHYVHSKAMAWVALDRGVRLVQDHGFDGVDVERWIVIRDEIRAAIEDRGVHHDGYFVQAFDTSAVDASLLNLALVGFVEPCDERMIKTVAAIERDLSESNGFIRRRATDETNDEAADEEGVFLLCTLWMVEVLALQGETTKATELFDRVAAVANDVGLFAEEYSVEHQEFRGNFPQAFTHLGLIAADHRLRACAGQTQMADTNGYQK